jgi:hypothetical protein
MYKKNSKLRISYFHFVHKGHFKRECPLEMSFRNGSGDDSPPFAFCNAVLDRKTLQ